MTANPDVSLVLLEVEFIDAIVDIFENKQVFNHTLGIKALHTSAAEVTATLKMRPELVGHFAYNRLHGGVISACLDTLGAHAIMAAMGARYIDEPIAQRLERFSKFGTIDLRVDYLRPAIGEHFTMRAHVLHLGSRLARSRMEFLAADGTLLSTGLGAYIVADSSTKCVSQ
jgi:uncharacterized protein (TIGR00369 family)